MFFSSKMEELLFEVKPKVLELFVHHGLFIGQIKSQITKSL